MSERGRGPGDSRAHPGLRGAAALTLVCALACSGGGASHLRPEVFDPAPIGYSWRLPPGFRPPPVPADNPMTSAKVELGRHLFYEERLSLDGTFSCATCHLQELAFTDGRAQALGVTGEVHPRSAMSLANVAYNATFTWADDSLLSLERQMLTPMFGRDPVEMGLAGMGDRALERLAQTEPYPELFTRAFPGESEPLTLSNLIKSLASFERTLISGRSAYDRFVYEDDREALDPSARRGMDLFFSPEVGCFHCHAEVTFSGPVVFEGATSPPPTFHNTGLYDLDGRGGYPDHDRGLLEVTGKRRDMGRFRAPTLRNVGVTAPYMHDGSVTTLEEVVEHYAAGGRAREEGAGRRVRTRRSPRLTGFSLTPVERSDLVAFLEALTDEGFLSDPAFSAPR